MVVLRLMGCGFILELVSKGGFLEGSDFSLIFEGWVGIN